MAALFGQNLLEKFG